MNNEVTNIPSVLPIYFIIEKHSANERSRGHLDWNPKVDELLRNLDWFTLPDYLQRNSYPDGSVKLGVITFSNDSCDHTKLHNLGEATLIHNTINIGIGQDGLTIALNHLNNSIKDSDLTLYQPALIFLLLISNHNDDYRALAQSLHSHDPKPKIIVIRTPNVSADVAKILATTKSLELKLADQAGLEKSFDWIFNYIKNECNNRQIKQAHDKKEQSPGDVSTTLPQPSTATSQQAMPSSQISHSHSSDTTELGDKNKPNNVTHSSTSNDKPSNGQNSTHRVLPNWKELEPTDIEDPFDHVWRDMVTSPSGWRIVGASRRGKSHAHDGKYREDAFNFTTTELGWHLVAIADGTGSCSLSRVGANQAVKAAVTAMEEALKNDTQLDISLEEQAHQALQNGFLKAFEVVHDESINRNKSLSDFSTTLGLLLHYPDPGKGDLLAIAQVGDPLLAAWFGGQQIKTLAEADCGAFASESLFLTSPGVMDNYDMRIKVLPRCSPHMLVLMTDGVANDYYPHEKHLPSLFAELDEKCRGANCDDVLLDWLKYDKRGSFDDRTVVILYPLSKQAVDRNSDLWK